MRTADIDQRRRARAASLAGLYAVTPDLADTARLVRGVEAALAGGARAIQYRNKAADSALAGAQAAALARVHAARGGLYIVNDDPALAAAVDADGVHLGEDDGAIAEARGLIGPERIIGVSCYNRMELAEAAVAAGADYVAFGSFYASNVKPGARRADLSLLPRSRSLGVPIVAIGGITAENAHALFAAGADAVAVISAVFDRAEPRDIERAARANETVFRDVRARAAEAGSSSPTAMPKRASIIVRSMARPELLGRSRIARGADVPSSRDRAGRCNGRASSPPRCGRTRCFSPVRPRSRPAASRARCAGDTWFLDERSWPHVRARGREARDRDGTKPRSIAPRDIPSTHRGQVALGRERIALALEERYCAAESAFEKGNRQRAEALAHEVLTRYRYHVGALTLAGTLAALRGEFAVAVAHFEVAVRERPDDADVRFNLAQALDRGGRTTEASAAYRQVLALSPAHPHARARLVRLGTSK